MAKQSLKKSVQKPKIGIIGVGMVGGAVRRYFESRKVKPFLYDKGKKLGSLQEVNKADVVFVCVPTPFIVEQGKGFDLSYVDDAVKHIEGSKIIIIKSTVWPGTTEEFQKRYPQHKFLFNPEFLSEATVDDDFQHPDRQIIGYTNKSKDIARDILDILPSAPFEMVIPSAEAEMVKYFNNTFNAVKVVFGNQIYDLCQALGLNYDRIMECAAASRFIGTQNHLHVWHKGYRGYGGKCLIKDIRALIQFADKNGVDLKLHKTVEEINNQLIKSQDIKNPENI